MVSSASIGISTAESIIGNSMTEEKIARQLAPNRWMSTLYMPPEREDDATYLSPNTLRELTEGLPRDGGDLDCFHFLQLFLVGIASFRKIVFFPALYVVCVTRQTQGRVSNSH